MEPVITDFVVWEVLYFPKLQSPVLNKIKRLIYLKTENPVRATWSVMFHCNLIHDFVKSVGLTIWLLPSYFNGVNLIWEVFILFQRIWEENGSFSFNLFCFPFLHGSLKALVQTFCVICVADYICMRNSFQDIFYISWRYYNTLYVIKPKQIVLLHPLPWPLIILVRLYSSVLFHRWCHL